MQARQATVRRKIRSGAVQRWPRLVFAGLALLLLQASPAGAATEVRNIVVDGTARSYRIFSPPDAHNAAVVIALHGAAQSAAEFEADFGMNRIAARENFVVVYPEGLNRVWDDARPPMMRLGYVVPPGDDVRFLTTLIRTLVRQGIADPGRIYLAGLSMGGFMTARMVCEHPQYFAAIAIMAATVPERYRTECHANRAMPALIMHGTLDAITPWHGLPVPGAALLSAVGTAQYYAELAGCMGVSEQTLPQRRSRETVTVRRWSICRDHAAVLLYGIEGGGHLPPSSQAGRGETFVSLFLRERSHAIDAAEEIWKFFRQFWRPDLAHRGSSAQ